MLACLVTGNGITFSPVFFFFSFPCATQDCVELFVGANISRAVNSYLVAATLPED
jgi:hypothetical protein